MAETYDVYFGTPGNLVLISNDQAGLSITVPYTLEYNTTYNWRVDSVDEFGTTTGDVWSFTCLVFTPPTPSQGLNNMVTIKRLVTVANNKVFYET